MSKTLNLDKISPLRIGVLQGGLVCLYVLLFAISVISLDGFSPEKVAPVLAITIYLLVFIISALVCSSLVLGYPLILAFKGNIKRAIQIVAWSAATIIGIALLVLVTILVAL